MSSVAQRQRVGAGRRTRRSKRESRPRERAQARPRLLAGGVIWIVLFASLLAGVVAVNVAVLRLNLALDGTTQERTQLKADIAGLRAGISSAGATSRIELAARGELGLVEADPDSTVYVTLPAK
jgi:cell division protein FtsL